VNQTALGKLHWKKQVTTIFERAAGRAEFGNIFRLFTWSHSCGQGISN
jgi:hypothetical protein